MKVSGFLSESSGYGPSAKCLTVFRSWLKAAHILRRIGKLKASAWDLQRLSNGVAVSFFLRGGHCRRRLGRDIECAANHVMAGFAMSARFPPIYAFFNRVCFARLIWDWRLTWRQVIIIRFCGTARSTGRIGNSAVLSKFGADFTGSKMSACWDRRQLRTIFVGAGG